MQEVLLLHYGCWQFIIQTKPEQTDEEATYKEKLDLQLRKDRCYTLIYTNISSDLKNLIAETTDGVAAWKILKDHFEPVTRAKRIQSTGNKSTDGKKRLQELSKLEQSLILEANRLQLMKQDLESEKAYEQFHFEEVEDVTWCYGCSSWRSKCKNELQKKGGRKPSVLHLKPFGCLAYAGVPKQIRKNFDMRAKMGIMMGYAQRTKGYRIWLIDEINVSSRPLM
ncbi:retrovirus-related Pol polyprotein from transposon TNT 1-94 [Trichonephila clavipes]|nr:retrovirus-related Pol polyprotein from transposon TNT 1-94 [Trichonephila clavipes]